MCEDGMSDASLRISSMSWKGMKFVDLRLVLLARSLFLRSSFANPRPEDLSSRGEELGWYRSGHG